MMEVMVRVVMVTPEDLVHSVVMKRHKGERK